jgi:hypothetical protein
VPGSSRTSGGLNGGPGRRDPVHPCDDSTSQGELAPPARRHSSQQDQTFGRRLTSVS